MTKRLMVLKESLQKNDEKYNNLKDLLSMPMMACTAMESDSAMSEQVQQMMQAAQHNPQILQQTMGQMEEKFGDLPDTILDQAAISYVKGAYQDLGMDMDHIQLHYLFTTGAKMLFLAFCGMAISILVGLLASRVGASAGRDLRSRVFRKVVGFSNNEFDISLRSLITRSTNDIPTDSDADGDVASNCTVCADSCTWWSV